MFFQSACESLNPSDLCRTEVPGIVHSGTIFNMALDHSLYSLYCENPTSDLLDLGEVKIKIRQVKVRSRKTGVKQFSPLACSRKSKKLECVMCL